MFETKLHHYCFNTRKPEELQAWNELEARLTTTHRKMHSYSRESVTDTGIEFVRLEDDYLFDNQWNEEKPKNRRLFDWYQEYRLRGPHIKQGYWLELTDEMLAARNVRYACGYCGTQVTDTGGKVFHESCLRSEYLTLDLLHLIRFQLVDYRTERTELTPEESSYLLPKYKVAQGLGIAERDETAKSVNRRKVADLIPNAERETRRIIEAARIETEAYTWLLDHDINMLDNVIYYPHTARFCFGWRNPLTPKERSFLEDNLTEFLFDYDLKG